MKVRTIAGLGMTLLAAGLMTIYFLNPDFPDGGRNDAGRSDDPASDEMNNKDSAGDIAEFLAQYNATYRALWTDAATADFAARSAAGPETNAAKEAARVRLDEFIGSRAVVEKLRLYRDRLDLGNLQDRQIESAWRLAADGPAAGETERARMRALTGAVGDTLAAFLAPAPTNSDANRRLSEEEIGGLLAASRDTTERRALWEAGHVIGPILKDNLEEMRGLRNTLSRDMGYSSYFGLKAADYELTSPAFILLMDELATGLQPLYNQLHCWVKHELARRYGAGVPDRIPAHWLDNSWGGPWDGVVEGADLDTHFRDVQPQWIVEEAERFYISLGFEPLPLAFWGRSDLFPATSESGLLKSNRDVALHLDLEQDVRVLLHVQRDFDSFLAAHRQLAVVYSQLAVSGPEVPPILRSESARVFSGVLGELGALSARQIPYLKAAGIVPPEETPEEIRWLMSQALQGPVVSIPFLCGTLAHWEHDLYENDLPRHLFNTRWWEYAGQYQGIEPAVSRGEDSCDPAALSVVHLEPVRGYDQAVRLLIGHQLHSYICEEIVKQDVRAANYTGNKNVGRFLLSVMESGATRDWAQVTRQATGQELSATALLDYYEPLLVWLQTQNEGRETEFSR
jgi:peptidyl-dipeptidase A